MHDVFTLDERDSLSVRALRRRASLASLLIAVAGLAGCANLNSIYREYQVEQGGKGTSAVIDVKQRAILSNTVYDKNGKGQQVVCAEPSPDALSVIASGVGGSLTTGPTKALELALSSTETGAYIGNRTATIQLLRDMLYRACEMYMGGAIDEAAYLAFQRRYQIMTMGLLAIEQITGTVKVSPFAVAAGQASAAAVASQLKQKREELAAAMGLQTLAKASVAEITQKVADRKKELDAATADDAKKAATANLKAAEEELTKAKKTQAEVDANVKLLEKEYEGALNGGTRSSVGGGSLLQVAAPAAATSGAGLPDPAVAVANTAKDLVEIIVRSAFQQEECFSNARNGGSLNPNCDGHIPNIWEVVAAVCKDEPDTVKLQACVGRTSNALKLPDALFANLADPKTPLRQALDPERRLSSSVDALARKLVPTPTLADLRYDVFATPGQLSQQDAVVQALSTAGAKSVRRRSVSEEQCQGTFTIVPGRPTVRFDAGNESERTAAQQVAKVIARALNVNETAVAVSPAATPTPLYLSAFLCGPGTK